MILTFKNSRRVTNANRPSIFNSISYEPGHHGEPNSGASGHPNFPNMSLHLF